MSNDDTPADLLRDLIAAKLDPSLIARVSLMVSRVSDLDRRRKNDAARQQKARDSKTNSHVTSRDARDVTLVTTPPDCVENQQLNGNQTYIDSSLTSSSDSTLEKKEEVVVARESKPRANRGQTVPEDMKLSIKNLEYALSKGWDRQRAFSEWDRFKDGSISKGRTYRNIDAAWRNWVTSPYQKETPAGKFNLMSGIDGVI